jgi:adenine-specific DNA-methyltransferase
MYLFPEASYLKSPTPKDHLWSSKTEKEAERIFSEQYPAIYKYFNQFRDQLIARSDQGRFFWELRSCKYWQDFEKPKIIFPDIALSSRYTYYKESMYVDMTAFIIPTQNLYVLGVLNSIIAETFIALISSSVRGDYLRFKRQYVSQIPIPTVGEGDRVAIEELVQKCLDAKGQNVKQWEQEIDEIVARLYGLSEEEMQIIRGEQS